MATKQKEIEPIRKITIRDVIGGIAPKHDEALMRRLINAPKEAVALMRVWGIAKVSKLKVTDNGESFAFIGQFRATALYGTTKGGEYSASKCYLPKFLEEELVGLIGAGNPDGVQFAFEIGVKYDKASVTSYQYNARPLIAANASGALAALEAQFTGKALPAPKAD